jgi:hypothetical protein
MNSETAKGAVERQNARAEVEREQPAPTMSATLVHLICEDDDCVICRVPTRRTV